jgi:hypothetical protein
MELLYATPEITEATAGVNENASVVSNSIRNL